MSRYAEIENNIVQLIMICEPSEIPSFEGVWILCDGKENARVGAVYDSVTDTFSIPPRQPVYKTFLNHSEFVFLWEPSEWDNLKRISLGEFSPDTYPDVVAQTIRQFLDSIALRNDLDVSTANPLANEYFQFLVDANILTVERVAELQQGILVRP